MVEVQEITAGNGYMFKCNCCDMEFETLGLFDDDWNELEWKCFCGQEYLLRLVGE